MRNYYNNEWLPTISASDFDKDDKKLATSVFSGCHNAVFWYLMISSIVFSIITYGIAFFFPSSKVEVLIQDPLILYGMQIFAMYAVAFPIYCVLVRKIPKAEQREKSTVRFGEFLALFAICLLMMQLGSYVSLIAKEYLSSRFALPSDLQMTYSLLAAGDVIPEILFAVILAPIFEELIFRKLMIDRLSIYGDRLAVIVSSIAFGLFHGNITQLFFATMIGFVLGHIYTKTRRVSYTIVIHMLVNLFGTLPYVIYYLIYDEVLISTSVSVPMEGLGIAYNVFIIIHFALLVFGFVMLLVALFAKKYRLSRLCDVEIPVTKFLGVVVLNKGTLLFFAYCVLNIVLTFLIVGQ